MDNYYFNYSTYIAENGREYRRFINQWRQIYAADKRWVALHHRQLALLRRPTQSEHLARYNLRYIHLEALPRRRRASAMGASLWEEVVAAALVAVDKRRRADTGLLMLLHCANDEESLDRLLGVALEELAHQGCYRLIGPVGPSPHLMSGILDNYFHVLPPLYTPYNPPYLPELMSSSLHPWQRLALLHIQLPSRVKGESIDPVAPPLPCQEPMSAAEIQIIPLTAALALTETFLPLWQAACLPNTFFPLPDPAEVAFLWAWLTVWPWIGWVAIAQQKPVGFVLLQPDLAQQSRRAGGGRSPLWALWLQWRAQRPVAAGRVCYGAILPEWQGQRIEELLWQQTLQYAQQQAWRSITIGPRPAEETAYPFSHALQSGQGRIEIQQRYTIYASER